MTPTEFIIEKLDDFASSHTDARLRYEYDSRAIVHTVEISPVDLYNSDECKDWQMDMLLDFVSKFPFDNIAFVSDKDSVGINNPTYINTGVDYEEVNTKKTESLREETKVSNDIRIVTRKNKFRAKVTA